MSSLRNSQFPGTSTCVIARRDFRNERAIKTQQNEIKNCHRRCSYSQNTSYCRRRNVRRMREFILFVFRRRSNYAFSMVKEYKRCRCCINVPTIGYLGVRNLISQRFGNRQHFHFQPIKTLNNNSPKKKLHTYVHYEYTHLVLIYHPFGVNYHVDVV